MKQVAGLLVLLIIFSLQTSGQSPDYKQVFGDDWDKAGDFLEENKGWISSVLDRYDIDYHEASAVIFPELVRYSALRDKMEITLLKALYVNIGKEYANFSIGQFQMKPSFAESVAIAAREILQRKYRNLVLAPSSFKVERDYRTYMVASLEDVRSELLYLLLFIKICEKKYDLSDLTGEGRVRFLATAYNYGFSSRKEKIIEAENRKFFSTRLFKSETWCYSDISAFWYKSQVPPYKAGKDIAK
ncbi:MAG: hypothetical protein U0X39_08530 [Bacteroidales bacterium]